MGIWGCGCRDCCVVRGCRYRVEGIGSRKKLVKKGEGFGFFIGVRLLVFKYVNC